MRNKTQRLLFLCAACGVTSLLPCAAGAEDWAMWCRTPNRNMGSPEKNPPTEWDAKGVAEGEPGKNIKWSAQLGSQSYGNTIVANGMVFVGSNNEAQYDKSFNKDAGVLLAFDEKTGKFL